MCILALSITPVAFLHTIAANHKDKTCELPGDHYCSAGINCKCLDLVAEGQFLACSSEIKIIAEPVYQEYSNPHIPTSAHSHIIFEPLRGPPIAV